VFVCILPGKAVPEMTYTVSGGTLNCTHSLTVQFEEINRQLRVQVPSVLNFCVGCVRQWSRTPDSYLSYQQYCGPCRKTWMQAVEFGRNWSRQETLMMMRLGNIRRWSSMLQGLGLYKIRFGFSVHYLYTGGVICPREWWPCSWQFWSCHCLQLKK